MLLLDELASITMYRECRRYRMTVTERRFVASGVPGRIALQGVDA